MCNNNKNFYELIHFDFRLDFIFQFPFTIFNIQLFFLLFCFFFAIFDCWKIDFLLRIESIDPERQWYVLYSYGRLERIQYSEYNSSISVYLMCWVLSGNLYTFELTIDGMCSHDLNRDQSVDPCWFIDNDVLNKIQNAQITLYPLDRIVGI